MPATNAEISGAAVALSSGHGTDAAVATLKHGMLAIRMILLRTLIDELLLQLPEIAEHARLSTAYRGLVDLQRSHPSEVAALLSYPHTGLWLAHVLQRMHTVIDDGETPLWADCGYLGWLAAAGGITCRTEGSMTLVVRDGVVMLPGLGMARLGSTEYCGHSELHWTSDGILHFSGDNETLVVTSVDSETDPGWLPLRRLRAAAEEPEVLLDDLDPFRDLQDDRPVSSRLTPEEARAWQQSFAAAWELLQRDLDQYVPPMRGCLWIVAPLSAQPLVNSTSHTSLNGVGCVYTTAPADPCQLALTLVHEIQHTKFTLLTDQILLFEPDPVCRFYAPWRDDPRPIPGLMHGIYAFFGVTDFWRVHRHAACHGSMQAHVDFELWRMQVEEAIAQASKSGLLTAAGVDFLEALGASMRPWSVEYVPDAARTAASEVSTAHRAFWQVRNLAPNADGITELAAQWVARTRQPSTMPSSVIFPSTVPKRFCRLHLSAQLKAIDPDVAEVFSSPAQPRGDRAYLAGELSRAVTLYTHELSGDPLRPQPWAGLALALPKLYPGDDFGILDSKPEVAAHLCRAVQADADEIIDLLLWLSSGQQVHG